MEEKKSDEQLAVSTLKRATILALTLAVSVLVLAVAGGVLEEYNLPEFVLLVLSVLIIVVGIEILIGPLFVLSFSFLGLVFSVCNLKTGTAPRKYWVFVWAIAILAMTVLYLWGFWYSMVGIR